VTHPPERQGALFSWGQLRTDLVTSSPKKGSGFVLRRDSGERVEEINRLYNDFTGRNRSIEAYRWEFYEVPSGPALVWTIDEVTTGQIVGHHALVPTPLCWRDQTISRTHRHKVFYPGMERRALGEAQRTLRILYTVDASIPGPLRKRFGYKVIGRWVIYLPKIGPRYLHGLLKRAKSKVAPWLPDGLLAFLARISAWVFSFGRRTSRVGARVEVEEIGDVTAIGDEYAAFWERARSAYDPTIDRSIAFLKWRCTENPHLAYRTWTLRKEGRLHAVVIAHLHMLGGGSALYIDDVISSEYSEAAFDQVLDCLDRLDPSVDSIVLMTLAVDTPLHRALRERFPIQTQLLRRFAPRLFGELMALDSAGEIDDRPWYATAIFTEGMDTSRAQQPEEEHLQSLAEDRRPINGTRARNCRPSPQK
jgi:hypothetical protein